MINIVMIGCGGFARRYHVPALRADAETRIAAIFDPHPAPETRALAEQYGAALVADIGALPDPSGSVLAIVTTPHTLHAAHVAAALARGWPVLCDKPFVSHAAEARSLAADAQRRGLRNAVAFNRRFDRGCLMARQALADGTIGALRFVQSVQLGYERAGWFLDPALGGGGPYTGRASHIADLVPWLTGLTPTRLRSRVRHGPPGRSDHGGFIELHFGQLECHMTCIEEGWHGFDEIRLFGEAGMIELRRPQTLPLGWSCRITTRQGEAESWLAADPDPGAATRDMLRALRTGSPVACDFAQAALSVRIVEQAFASGRDGEWKDLA
jgi:phthalate 4,5-cis-dihydrodiol dehydrogenase